MLTPPAQNGNPPADSSQSHLISAPTVSIPRGGGAIKGIGEKFAANPVTGTGSMQVPLATSPGRSGFGPQFSLSYDSGSGNGPFGFGWNLSLPSITRKTDKGLPRYQDTTDPDVFILSGAEDLVPVLKKNDEGKWQPEPPESRQVDGKTYTIQPYRPRIEGLFARIERWTNVEDGTSHWRSISRDNITTLYGKDEHSRIVDPEDKTRIFSWLICESYDDKGNAIVYEYKHENDQGVDTAFAHEQNRTTASRSTNRYLKRIKYGNRVSRLIQPDLDQAVWLFEVVFDYGEHDRDTPTPSGSGEWLCRHDPFSSCRAGFEVRTYRLCQRVLMFHHFPEEAGVGQDCLVRSTDFVYRNIRNNKDDLTKGHPIASFIAAVTQSGYKRKPDGGGYLQKSMPPLEFEYSQAEVQEDVQELDPQSLENLPYGLDNSTYQWVDLDGEGVSGILTEQAGAWFYKPNLGDGKFGPLQKVAVKPSLAVLAGGQQQLLDLAGDGQLDLVELDGPIPGFFERPPAQTWEEFTPFESLPRVAWDDPNLRFVDLNGDGHADVLVTEHSVLTWYPSLAEDGFGAAHRVQKPRDEENGPRLVFADGTQSIYLADMVGDGLTDLVRVRNGEVCYWPSLGYGRFGAKVTMDHAPWFDARELFDQRRIRLADIDGSGNTDIIYLSGDGVALYFNQSGNSWSDPHRLSQFPQVDNLSAIATVDLFGNGTACLVWSSPLPGAARRPMRYIDLMGSRKPLPDGSLRTTGKPHLLIGIKNNLGAETRIEYVSSTYFYLQDKEAGTPWITRIPFPVHVVERVKTYDHISRNRFVTRYSYHHGYFDGIEREFRGFGRVEQQDTEEYEVLKQDGAATPSDNIDPAYHVPPVLTKTWFHTGAYIDGQRISRLFEREYYRESDASAGVSGLSEEDLKSMLLDDTVLPPGLSAEEEREACRSLKGAILRQEVYGLDKSEAADRPYSVSERNYTIEPVQPRGQNRHAVFFTYGRETVDYHYERKLFKVVGDQIVDAQSTDASAQELADPRVTHTVNLSVDAYGNILQSVAIGYGRRFGDAFAHVSSLFNEEGRTKQQQTLITFTENQFTHAVEEDNAYRTPLPWETRTFEVLKVDHKSVENNLTNLFRFDELKDLIDTPAFAQGTWDLPYHDVNHEGATENRPYRRLIEHVRTVYRKNDLSAFLGLKELESLALSGETFKLAFTPGLLNQVFQRPKKESPDEKENLLPDPVGVLPVDLADRDDRKVADRGGYVSSQTLKRQKLFPEDAAQPFWTTSDEDGNWWIPSGQIFYSREYSRDEDHDSADELAFAQEHFFLPHRFRDPFDENSVLTYDDYNLLLKESHDPLENQIQAVNDYRLLQPRQITDPNGNRSQVAFDALGMVVATAVMGKAAPAPAEGDSLEGVEPDLLPSQVDGFYGAADPHSPAIPLLGNATTRIVYDLEAYQNSQKAHPEDPARWLPVYAATIARETHVNPPQPADGLKVQISFSYSDGFGREIQKKIQAERGPLDVDDPNSPIVDPRWVGSGWTIFNNKGKPVRQYEPFFSAHHGFQFAKTVGVSSTLFYDPVERVVATLHPNHTYEKVVFDPWQQTTWDVNDTVLQTDPAQDPDVGGFLKGLPTGEYLPTWYSQRQAEAVDSHEKKAAEKAKVHANTPTVAYFDSLGRTVLTVAHNRSQYRDKPLEEDYYTTLVRFDLEGNQREVVDAKGRIVMRYDYDLLGNRIHQASMEAGQRWMLNDVAGKPIYAWDSRWHQFRTKYDALRRPIAAFVQGALAADPTQEICYEKTEYGEGQEVESGLTDRELNLRTRVFRQYDSAGIVTNLGQNPETGRAEAYDFKGNLLHSSRQFAQEYKAPLDWNQDVPLEPGLDPFTSHTTYDALNRPVTMTAPDQSEIRPTYNEANLLEGITARLQRGSTVTSFVNNIDYNAKGQRLQIEYGNGVRTTYRYDKQTFRLIHLFTSRGAAFPGDCPFPPGAPCGVQNLHYVYDPVGNITHIQDDAQQTIYFDGQVVEPHCDYTYDAIYRLIEATGREHLGQVGSHRDAPIPLSHDDSMRMNRPLPTDGQAMGRYWQRYVYDAVGNFLEMAHRGGKSGSLSWSRKYEYEEESLLEGNPQKSNRLSRTVLNPDSDLTNQINEAYGYDEHGNMTTMPHLSVMWWDFKDQLQMSQRQKVNDNDADGEERKGERTYYVYDAAGQRVRKVTELANGNPKDERIYLGSYEVYRRHSGENAGLVRESLHIMDDQQRVAIIETRNDVNDSTGKQLIRYQFGNHLGSVSMELDGQAQIISYEEYTPYGSTSYQAVQSQTEMSKQYRYTGKERDEENGLYYHGARYYISWLGRWTTVDPIGILDGVNLYAYVVGNPIGYLDHDGTQHIDIGNDPALQAEAGAVHNARTDLAQAPSPTVPAGPQVTYAQARSQAGTGQRAFRRLLGLRGSTVQAGHTMDVEQSVGTQLPRNVRDNPQTMMALHSRIDPSLEVRLTDPQNGQTVVRTRHTGQELLIRQGTERAAVRTGGVLTREGQVAASQDVLYQTENTPWDQRNVDRIRSSPRSPEGLSSVDADVDPATGRVDPRGSKTSAAIARRAAASGASTPSTSTPAQARPHSSSSGGSIPVTPPSTSSSALGAVGRAAPFVAEAEVSLVGGAYAASLSTTTAPLVTPLLTAAEALPVAAGVGVVGAGTGHLARYGASKLGASQSTANTVGLGAAVLTGAALGSVIPGVGTAVGAGVGALVAGGLYLWSL